MTPIKILLVDDHAVMRKGLASLLGTRKELQVVGDADDGASGIRMALKLKPDVVIMDLMMPEMDGVETTRQLLARMPNAKVLILTSFGSADGIAHALASGAKGALMKTADLAELLDAIRAVSRGERSVSPEIEQILTDDPPVPELSPRQTDIMKSVIRGLTNEDIARQLNISLPMVKEHVKALFTKIGAANRTEAVAIALRKHLLKI